MRIDYHLDQKDYLSYFYYSASKSQKVQKRRKMNKIILIIIYLITAVFLYNRNGPVAAGIFIMLCLPLYFLYGRFEKRQYTRHFNRFIKMHFQNQIGKSFFVEFNEESMRVVDEDDITYTYNDITSIEETPDLFILQLESGVAVLLPKNKIADQTGALREKLHTISNANDIPFQTDLAWEWK